MTNFSCYIMAAVGLHLDNLLSEGFSHIRTAHLLPQSVKTGKLGCHLNRVCQIMKDPGARLTPITRRYQKVFSIFDQCSFSNISFKIFILCVNIYN